MERERTSTIEPGTVFAGYRIEALVAEGGMGRVYRARKEVIEREVALKILHPHLVTREDFVQRFLREARVAASLEHPAIIRVYDAGEEDGLYYLAMEFVGGRDLRTLVEEEGPLAPARAFAIGREIALALDFAHGKDVVHRDIKPANVILDSGGRPKIADFGLARPRECDTQVTSTGQILGTPVYMSPEQCRGEPLDGRSDLYSLGATLYFLLSGKPPFEGPTSAALIHKVLHEKPRPLNALRPGIPAEVTAVVNRLLAKHRAARYATGREAARAMKDALEGRSQKATSPRKIQRTERRRAARRFVPLGALLLLALGIFLLLGPARRPPPAGAQTGTDSAGTGAHEAESGAAAAVAGPAEPRAEGPEVPAAAAERLLARKELEERVAEFREALLEGRAEELEALVVPERRSDRRFLFRLARAVEAIRLRRLTIARDVIHLTDSDNAKVVLLFRHPLADRSFPVPLDWVRRGGRWYVSEAHFRLPGRGRRGA